jgi:hypothetical protein
MGIANAVRLAGVAAVAAAVVLSGMSEAVAASRPSAPRSVVATPGNTSVKVTWTSPSSNGGAAIDKYAVQRAASATGTWGTVGTLVGTARAWTNTGLVNGHRYYFRVRAHNVVGWSAASTSVSAVPRTMPSAPRSPVATAGDTTVQLTWTQPSTSGGAAINGYSVQRAASSTGTWSTVATLAATARAWTNAGLVNGTRYYFRVRAHNVAGWGAASPTVSAVPHAAASPPSAPQSLAWTSGDGSVTVSWSAPVNSGGAAVDAYEVQLSLDDVAWSLLPSTTQTNLTAMDLENGTQYYVRVRAHNAAGWGSASSEIVATPGLPLAPAQVWGVPDADGVDFHWAPSATVNPAVTQYEVAASDYGDNWDYFVVSSDVTDWLIQDGTGVTLYLRVRALNSAGYSKWSATASAVEGFAPGAVGNLTAENWSFWAWNVVSWDAPTTGSAPLGYRVERAVGAGTWQYVTSTQDLSYTDSGVSSLTTYNYRITPYNELGDGPSSTVSITTK